MPWQSKSLTLYKYYNTTSCCLMQWLERPPLEANEQDLRRVGYILGTLGGIESVDTLTRHLGSAAGVDRPEVQGALLGALGARTY